MHDWSQFKGGCFWSIWRDSKMRNSSSLLAESIIEKLDSWKGWFFSSQCCRGEEWDKVPCGTIGAGRNAEVLTKANFWLLHCTPDIVIFARFAFKFINDAGAQLGRHAVFIIKKRFYSKIVLKGNFKRYLRTVQQYNKSTKKVYTWQDILISSIGLNKWTHKIDSNRFKLLFCNWSRLKFYRYVN